MRRGARVVQRPRACPDGLMHLSSAPSEMGFSPDGRVLAAHCDGMIWLADTELGVGEQAIRLPGTAHGLSVGTSVVVMAHDGRLLVYNSHAAKLVHRIRAGGEVGALALSNDGVLLASCTDRHVMLHRVLSGRRVARLPLETPVRSLCFCPDDLILAGLTTTGFLVWWRVPDLAVLGEVAAPPEVVSLGALEGRWVAGGDKTVWYASSGETHWWANALPGLFSASPRTGHVVGHAPSPGGLAVWSEGSTVRVGDRQSAPLDVGAHPMVAIHPAGQDVAWVDAKGVVRLAALT
ncbi:MAG: WD40 repeat domain-containing protein [Myxococcota bacterium]